MAKDYDHKKYGSVMKGRSAEQLANWQKDFGSKSKALKKKTSDPYGHAKHRKMFDSPEHKKAVARGKAQERMSH